MRKIDFALFHSGRCFGSNYPKTIYRQIIRLFVFLLLGYSTTHAQICPTPANLLPITVTGSDATVCDNGAGSTELAVDVTGGLPNVGTVYAIEDIGSTLDIFPMQNVHQPGNNGPVISTANNVLSGDLVNGVFYVIETFTNTLNTVDLVTGVLTPIAAPGATAPVAGETWTNISWDASTNTMYGISSNVGSSTLHIIDINTGQVTPINGTGLPAAMWIAIDNDGNAYGADGVNLALYEINLVAGSATLIGPTGINFGTFFNGADFDPLTGQLYTLLFNVGSGFSELHLVDINTGAYTLLNVNGGPVVQYSAFGLLNTNTTAYNYIWSTNETTETISVSAPGAYTVTVSDECGSTAEFTINVTGEAENTSTSCNADISTGIGADGTVVLTPETVLEGEDGCLDGYTVEIMGTGSNVADCSMIGSSYMVGVFDAVGNTVCMNGGYTFDDKMPPSICCGDLVLSCTDDTDPGDITGPITGTNNFAATTPVTIPDGNINGVDITIEVPDACSQAVEDLDLLLQIDHTRVGELAATLRAPNGGATVLLFNRPGFPVQVPATGCIFDNIDVTFDDEATNSAADFENTCNGPNPAIGGAFNAIQSLSVFDGIDPSGDWTLTVYDLSAAGNGLGSVVSAELQITSTFSDKGIIVSDNCDTDVELTYVETDNSGCADEGFGSITRIWTATDDAGNTATCEQTITLTKPALTDIDCPLSYNDLPGQNPVISCENYVALPNGHPDPATYGEPQFNGQDINGFCMFNTAYVDLEILDPNCPDGKTYIRTWTILDMCNSSYVQCNQIIKIVDMTPPTIVCPADKTVGTTGTNASCSATTDLDPPTTLSDNCTTGLTYTVSTSAGTVSADLSEVSGLDLGDNTITYTTTDNCGNTASCSFTITVEDDDPPPCAGTTNVTVNLSGASSNVHWSSFISQATLDLIDNCSVSTALVKRGNDAWCTDDVSSNFDEYVTAYCCDIGQAVPVTLQLTDASNNSNECTVFINVSGNSGQDITCPVTADVPVDCDDLSPLDPPYAGVSQTVTDLEVYYVDENNVETFVGYYDPALVTYACAATTTVTVYIYDTGSVSACGTGTITRTYELRNASGIPTASCSYDFVVTNPPFNLATDVNWPIASQEVTLACTDIGNAPVPSLNISSCDNLTLQPPTSVGIDINDPNICFKILKTWKVLDHCTNGTASTTEVATLTQTINVTDGIAPVFTTCSVTPTTVDEGTTLDFDVSATDACTDAYPNIPAVSFTYSIDQGNDDPANPEVLNQPGALDIVVTGDGTLFPVGVHNVIFTATDACGVSSTCNVIVTIENLLDCTDFTPPPYEFNVGGDVNGATLTPSTPGLYNKPVVSTGMTMSTNGVGPLVTGINYTCSDIANSPYTVYFHLPSGEICEKEITIVDITPPILVCKEAQNILPINALPGETVTFNGADFITSANDICDGSNVTISVIPSSFTCPNVQGTTTQNVIITAADSHGTGTFCTRPITIICSNTPPLSIVSGDISNEANEMMTDVEVSPGQGMDVAMTDDDGTFNMNLPTLENYDITPVKDTDHLNGVSTYDIVLMSKHILGVELLDSPYKMIAADVNKSNEVSTLDMLQLRKVILFIDDEFQNNTSWRFVDAGFVFNDPTNPFLTTFPESYPINGLDTDMQGLDFIAVKTGDVNGTASVDGFGGNGEERTFDDELKLRIKDQQLKAGHTYRIEVKAADFNEMLGYQFTLGFDETAIDVLGVQARGLPGLSEANFNLQRVTEGVVTSSWNHPTALNLDENTVLFELEVRARQTIALSEVLHLSSRLTATEAYQENGNAIDLMDIALEYEDATGEVQQASRFELYQNKPNPFKDETLISFRLPESGAVRLKVFDLSGSVLTMITSSFDAGYNEISIDRSDLDGSGVLYYELSTANHTAVQKMIVID